MESLWKKIKTMYRRLFYVDHFHPSKEIWKLVRKGGWEAVKVTFFCVRPLHSLSRRRQAVCFKFIKSQKISGCFYAWRGLRNEVGGFSVSLEFLTVYLSVLLLKSQLAVFSSQFTDYSLLLITPRIYIKITKIKIFLFLN